MGKPLRVLIVEDSEDDVLLTILALKKGGYDPVYEQVETAEALRSALREKQWDVILCDYNLPDFNGLAAIELLKETELDLSLIIVSGAIGEETAVEAMKAGAHDYIMKDNLSRLTPAIDRELKEADERRARRLAEKQLKESNERFIALFDRSYDAVYIVDFEGMFVDANQVALNMLGYDRADIHGLSIASLLSEEDLSKGLKDFNEIVQTGFQKEISEYKLKRKDGKYVTVETKASVIYHEGKPYSVLGIARDITERRQAEEALRKTKEQLIEAHRLAQIGIWNWIVDTDTVTWTEELYHIAGLDPMIPAPTYAEHPNIYAPESWARLKVAAEKALETRAPYQLELKLIRPDGSTRWVNAFGGPIYDDHGRVKGLHGTVQDITERKKAEEKIKTLLEEKEFLLREVHHRIKNNMSTMISLLSLQSKTLDDPKAVTALEDAKRRMISMSVLYDKLYRTENLRAMSIKDYLPALVDEIIGVFPNKSSVIIETRIDDYILGVKVLSSLGIIVNELLTNAMKHAFIGRDDGLITVSASIKNHLATLVIEDNGNGIPESVDIETSSGFGLQLVGMLTKQIDGTIKIERGNGTRFVLEFERQ